MLASEVMSEAAALLNDQALATFTYVNMLPFLRKASNELTNKLAKNGISVLKQESAVSTVAAGASTLAIPADMFIPVSMLETDSSGSNLYSLMDETYPLPQVPASVELNYWSYYDLILHIGPGNAVGATSVRKVKLNYLRTLTSITAQGTVVEIGQSITFLAERTAGLCSEFIGEDPIKGDKFNKMALGPFLDGEGGSLGELISIYVRNNQGLGVRRGGFHRGRSRR